MLIILATSNPHKQRELRVMLADSGFGERLQVKSLDEFVTPFGIKEDGASFQENAAIKARAIQQALLESQAEINAYKRVFVLSEDSGLCVDLLAGLPGIYSARYFKSDTQGYHKWELEKQRLLRDFPAMDSEKLNIERVIFELGSCGESSAQFVANICLLDVHTSCTKHFEGICHGRVIAEKRGLNGFGYDCIFIPSGYTKTLAQLSDEEKNLISHRQKALKSCVEYLGSQESYEQEAMN